MPRLRFYAVATAVSVAAITAAYIFDVITDRVAEIIEAAIR